MTRKTKDPVMTPESEATGGAGNLASTAVGAVVGLVGEIGSEVTSLPAVHGVEAAGQTVSNTAETAIETTEEVGNKAGPASDATIGAVGEIGTEANSLPDIHGALNVRSELLRITHLNQLHNLSEQVDEERHPRVVAFFTSEAFSEDEPPSAILVTCEVDGLRRGGQRHLAGTESYALDHFTADQLDQLLSDANFKVELV